MAEKASHDGSADWTTRRLMQWTSIHLGRHGVEHPRVACEMLLAHVLGVPRLKLYTDYDRPANELERATFRELVQRAVAHEPVDYLVGRAPFFSLDFEVNRSVLIPRPSTEALVEHVIQHARRTPGFHAPMVADVGTGSGAIAVAVAVNLANSRVVATDTSGEALEVARRNATRAGVEDRIDWREGDMLEPIAGERFNYLLSNPPYISDDEWQQVPPNVKNHEPASALRGGVDGLRFLRPLVAHGHEHLQPSGQLVLEIAASQKQVVLGLAEQTDGLTNAHVLADHEGLPRVLVADGAGR